MIIVWNRTTKLPLYTVGRPWPEGTEENYARLSEEDPSFTWFVIDDPVSILGKWIDDTGEAPTIRDQEPVPGKLSAETAEVGDAVTLTGLPSGTMLSAGTETYRVDDGEFEMISDIAGSYVLTLTALPRYHETKHTVIFQ